MILLIIWILILAFFFAKVEIHIEGDNGWASALPTWRIEEHWLLDIFWGGRPMTGYHAWIFPLIILFFHLPFFFYGTWNWVYELKALASVQLFWLFEDFLWFVLNPAYGIRKFRKAHIPWHKRWVLFMPIDYWFYGILAMIMLWIYSLYA